MKKINYIGMILTTTALILGWLWFGWKLSLVLFIAITGNNMEMNKTK